MPVRDRPLSALEGSSSAGSVRVAMPVGEAAIASRAAAGRRFCLITCGNVSNRPRLLKEADCLAAAGHHVAVIAIDIDPGAAKRDQSTGEGRHWRLERVTLRRGTARGIWHRAIARGLQAGATAACRAGFRSRGVQDRALSRYLGQLVSSAASQRADVVIGHGLDALPVAARVARRQGAQLGFDCEDLHAAEFVPDRRNEHFLALVRAVEGHYLRRCSYLTAASDGIADALVDAYGIERPVVILNTFEKPNAVSGPATSNRPTGGLSLYWFSQVIGPGRGIEDALTALASLPARVTLHLRGRSDPTFVRFLRTRASELGVETRLVICPDVDPGALIPLAMDHDVGLALEPRVPRNRDVCITNKLFAYMTAGLAIAASDTSGQRSILERAPGAGFLFPPGDSLALANGLRTLVDRPETLARMKRAAAAAASAEFAWPQDAARLAAYLSGPGRGPSW